jgi:hypothetical protein
MYSRVPLTHTHEGVTTLLSVHAKHYKVPMRVIVARIYRDVPPPNWFLPPTKEELRRRSLKAEATKHGVNPKLVYDRRRAGLTDHRDLYAPPGSLKPRRFPRETPVFRYDQPITIGAVTQSAREWMLHTRTSEGKVRYWLRHGKSLEEIFGG